MSSDVRPLFRVSLDGTSGTGAGRRSAAYNDTAGESRRCTWSSRFPSSNLSARRLSRRRRRSLPPAGPGPGVRRPHVVRAAARPRRPHPPRHRPAHGGPHPRPRRPARLRAAPPRGRRAGQGRPRPRPPRRRRARPRPRPARRSGPARAAAQPRQRRLRAPGRSQRQGPLPRAPRPEPGRLPRHQPRQGLQPALPRLLRELRRPRRASRLGDLRAHDPRGARHLGHARLRHQRRASRSRGATEGARSWTSPSGSRTASS